MLIRKASKHQKKYQNLKTETNNSTYTFNETHTKYHISKKKHHKLWDNTHKGTLFTKTYIKWPTQIIAPI